MEVSQMDQATNIEIRIKGLAADVKVAALVAQRRIDLDTKGFNESVYEFDNCSDFESKLDEVINMLGSYDYNESEEGMAEYSTEQESYGCIEKNDIVAIAKDIVKTSPNVEMHISSVITAYYDEGYELCVDIDYVDGKMKVDSYKEYLEDEDDEGRD